MTKNGTQHQQGYIYRGTTISADQLQALLHGLTFTHLWAWSPTHMYSQAGQKEAKALLKQDQGRASNQELEIRWRKEGQQYDVLILTLHKHTLDNTLALSFGQAASPQFNPLRPSDDKEWQLITKRPYLLLRPIGVKDQKVLSTYFLAPNGATQFVALIG